MCNANLEHCESKLVNFLSVPSQVIVGRTLAKKQMLMSVATKICIQLNCKMGGEVWALEIPVSIYYVLMSTLVIT